MIKILFKKDNFKWLLFVILLVPYFWYPFDINLHEDVSMELIKVFRLVNSSFSFGLDYNSLFVNPLTHIIKNVHGIMTVVILYPLFYLADLLGLAINEINTEIIFILAGILITLSSYLFLKNVIGDKKAYLYSLFIITIPYYVMQIKGGWWSIYYYPVMFAGLFGLHKFLYTQEKKWYAFFCSMSALLMLSAPSFFFGIMFFIIYTIVYFYSQEQKLLRTFKTIFFKMILSPWTLLPLLTLAGLIVMSHFATVYLGGDYGVIGRIAGKTSQIKYYKPDILLHLGVHALGLVGFILFPAMILALGSALKNIKKWKENVFLYANVFYFLVVFFILFLVGGGTGARVNEFFFPGIIILIYGLEKFKKRVINILLISIILLATFTQTILYNFGYQPNNFLTTTGWFPFPKACQSIWCPWLFGQSKIVGIKTLGYVVHDYLQISPVPFISKIDSREKQKDFLFHNNYVQGPTMHIGRRISNNLNEVNPLPKTIVLFADNLIVQYPDIVDMETQKKVSDFVDSNEEYKNIATITRTGVPIIEVYELNSNLEYKVFPIEIYDKLFDQKYANLKSLGKIDLGS